ncbi:hypothetical protein Vretimale_9312 [Volvox reticuliferus]|uniref:Uncharacterized protein n=1 Tax=Volvox reticuliferus TaxID=1737510 RepID=A0A8J4CHB8_9CHLO|nr:hypothetical protein Vretifemale_10130 [Volvox reticuliferus]GIM04811.1 hypothetical protein Vretimale_9312 [Volvox reticuliferus]
MAGRLGSYFEGSAQPADAIQAFCRHLGELCEVLAAPYDAEALTRAASSQVLQGTNCNVLLHNALYQWLGERVELSLNDDEKPEAAERQARESALTNIHAHDMLSEFVQSVVKTCSNTDALVEVPPERGKHSLFFDLQGPIDLLGPEEVDSLLSELANSDSPIAALEAISSDIHLLEDLCFGPTWPQLCDALGRLVCLPAAATAGNGSTETPTLQLAQGTILPRQQQLLLTVLQELVSSNAASSPPHAAELLDALAPYLTALVMRLALPSDSGGTDVTTPASSTACRLLAAAASLDPFGVGLTRIAHQLLIGLATEYHMLPPGCAALAARAVCDVLRAGLARGAPAPTPATGAAAAVGRGIGMSAATLRQEDTVIDLSALDLLILLDPELRWWQRLCSATHATQPIAYAAAATQLAGALEAALEAWGSVAASVLAQGGEGAAPGARSSTHLVACTALLGGLVRANNLALLAVEPRGADGGANALDGSALRMGPPSGPAPVVTQQHWLRLQRMLGHLVSCFCVGLDKPWLLRPTARTPAVAATGPVVLRTAHAAGSGSGSVFLFLAAGVLSSAATAGMLSLLATTGTGTKGGVGHGGTNTGGGGGGSLAPILQAMLRAAAMTAATAGVVPGNSTSHVMASEADAWLMSAAKVLGAAADYALLVTCGLGAVMTAGSEAGAPKDQLGQPTSADAICGLLRHIVGRVRGCAATAACAVSDWSVQVIRAATPLASGSSTVALALNDLYDTLQAVLSGRAASGRSGPLTSWSRSSSPTRTAGWRSGCGGGGGGGGTHSGGVTPIALIDLLDSGASSVAEHGRLPASKRGRTEASLDDVQVLAAEAVMAYCRTDLAFSGAVAGEPAAGPPSLRLQLPAGLLRPVLLECAARRLCAEYDGAGCCAEGASDSRRAADALGVRRTAAKRRLARQAGALARCCSAGEQALVGAGFARRVLEDVASVLRSGEYESPYLEPLPYADPLAGLAAILADVLCWPGLLRLPEVEEEEAEEGGASEGRTGTAGADVRAHLQSRHRDEVLALLQELVTWLDARGAEGGGLPPADAAAVSLQAFSALVAVDPSAGLALERDTNIRWYLQNLCGTLSENDGDVGGLTGVMTAGHRDEPPQLAQQRQPSQSDMLLDMARVVLRAIVRPTTAK